MDVPLIADVITLQRNQQALIDQRLLKANASTIPYDYTTIGDEVLKKNYLGSQTN